MHGLVKALRFMAACNGDPSVQTRDPGLRAYGFRAVKGSGFRVQVSGFVCLSVPREEERIEGSRGF